MKRARLGKTALEVGRLSLGGLFVMSAHAELDEVRRILAQAVELGINYIDTAPGYGDSEAVLGRCLADIPAPLVLSTKLGYRPDPFEPRNKDLLRASVEESLRLLGRDRIDLLMIHEADRPRQFDWWTDMVKVEGPVLELLAELKTDGIIRYTGLGGTTTAPLAHLCRSGKFDVVLTAFNYSLLWREAANDVIPAAREAGMGVIVGSPLQQGVLAARYDAQLDSCAAWWLSRERKAQFKQLYALLDETGMPLPELALRFVLSNPDVDTVLTGVKSVAELESSAAAAESGPLPEDILRRLDEIAAMVPFRPCEEPMALGGKIADPARNKGPGFMT